MTTYNNGVTTGGNTVNTTAQSTANGIVSTFDNVDLTSSGVDMMKGLVNGMESMKSKVIATAEAIAKAASQTIDNALDINSPSRVTQWSGEMAGLGMVRGLENMHDRVSSASYSLSDAMYQPEHTASSSSSFTENNSYAPQFTLNLSGTTDRTTERTVKRWIQESLKETFDSMGRTSPRLTEV